MPSLDSVTPCNESVSPVARVSGARRLLRDRGAQIHLRLRLLHRHDGLLPGELAADVEPETLAEAALAFGDLVLEGAGPLLRLVRLHLRRLDAGFEGLQQRRAGGRRMSRRPRRCLPPRGRLALPPPWLGRWRPRGALGGRPFPDPPSRRSRPRRASSASWACLPLARRVSAGWLHGPAILRHLPTGGQAPSVVAALKRVGARRRYGTLAGTAPGGASA